MNKNKKLEKA